MFVKCNDVGGHLPIVCLSYRHHAMESVPDPLLIRGTLPLILNVVSFVLTRYTALLMNPH